MYMYCTVHTYVGQICGLLVTFFFAFLRVHEALITFGGFHVLVMEKGGKGSAQFWDAKRSGTANMY